MLSTTSFFDPSRWYPQKDESLFQYWASFYPTSYLMGIKWRFAEEDAPLEEKEVADKTAKVTTNDMGEFIKQNSVAKSVKKGKAPKPAVKKEPVEAKPASKPTVVKAPTVSKKVAEPVKATAVPVNKEETAKVDTSKPGFLLSEKPASPDDLTLIKGVGPKLAISLNEMGIYTFKQLSGLSEKDLQWVDDNLTAFKGRAFRDNWVDQAKSLLAS